MGILLRDGAIEPDTIAASTAEQGADRETGGLAEKIPAGNVDAALHIGMPFQRRVHAVIEDVDLTRIEADQMWAELTQSSTDPVGVCRKVERTEWGRLRRSPSGRCRFPHR